MEGRVGCGVDLGCLVGGEGCTSGRVVFVAFELVFDLVHESGHGGGCGVCWLWRVCLDCGRSKSNVEVKLGEGMVLDESYDDVRELVGGRRGYIPRSTLPTLLRIKIPSSLPPSRSTINSNSN